MSDRESSHPTCWAVEIDNETYVPCESEGEAVDCWEFGEYVLGMSVVVHRGYQNVR